MGIGENDELPRLLLASVVGSISLPLLFAPISSAALNNIVR